MHPLLVSGISSLAGTALEGLQRALAPKQSAANEAQFTAALQQAQSIAARRAPTRESAIAALQQRLLETPELRTELSAADPAKMPALTLSPDGTITLQSSDGRARTLALSPETSATARELGALISSPLQLTSVPGADHRAFTSGGRI